MLDLQPIKARLAASTPDYWRWDRTITGLDANGDEEWLIISQDQHTPDAALVGTARSRENASLMAHSREDLSALVAEVERLGNEAAVMQQVTLAGLAAEIERLRAQLTEDGLRMVELEAELGSVRLDRDLSVKAAKKMEAAAADGVGAVLENVRLREAIAAHRDAFARLSFFPAKQYDLDLWKVLDNV